MKREEEEEDGYLKHYQHAHQQQSWQDRQMQTTMTMNVEYSCFTYKKKWLSHHNLNNNNIIIIINNKNYYLIQNTTHPHHHVTRSIATHRRTEGREARTPSSLPLRLQESNTHHQHHHFDTSDPQLHLVCSICFVTRCGRDNRILYLRPSLSICYHWRLQLPPLCGLGSLHMGGYRPGTERRLVGYVRLECSSR